MNQKILLLVEDNPLLIGMYESAFEKAGYLVTLAHDGAAGIAMAKETKPSNILLDLFMPGIDGFEVIKTLKDDPDTKDIGIVVLTSDTKEEDHQKALALGASDCLVKSELALGEIVERAIKSFK